jgi:dimethylamine/trimethylamine dehydrogenase
VHQAGVAVVYGTTVTGLERSGPAGGPSAGVVLGEDRNGEPWSMPCDAVVLVTQRRSRDRLYRELTADQDALADAGIEAVYRIGDAVAPRMLSEVIFDGHRLAREIDQPDPARPLPYLREQAGVRYA